MTGRTLLKLLEAELKKKEAESKAFGKEKEILDPEEGIRVLEGIRQARSRRALPPIPKRRRALPPIPPLRNPAGKRLNQLAPFYNVIEATRNKPLTEYQIKKVLWAVRNGKTTKLRIAREQANTVLKHFGETFHVKDLLGLARCTKRGVNVTINGPLIETMQEEGTLPSPENPRERPFHSGKRTALGPGTLGSHLPNMTILQIVREVPLSKGQDRSIRFAKRDGTGVKIRVARDQANTVLLRFGHVLTTAQKRRLVQCTKTGATLSLSEASASKIGSIIISGGAIPGLGTLISIGAPVLKKGIAAATDFFSGKFLDDIPQPWEDGFGLDEDISTLPPATSSPTIDVSDSGLIRVKGGNYKLERRGGFIFLIPMLTKAIAKMHKRKRFFAAQKEKKEAARKATIAAAAARSNVLAAQARAEARQQKEDDRDFAIEQRRLDIEEKKGGRSVLAPSLWKILQEQKKPPMGGLLLPPQMSEAQKFIVKNMVKLQDARHARLSTPKRKRSGGYVPPSQMTEAQQLVLKNMLKRRARHSTPKRKRSGGNVPRKRQKKTPSGDLPSSTFEELLTN